MSIVLKNNAESTLATAINATDTGLVVAAGDGAKFATLSGDEYFYLTLTSTGGTTEIVKVTARVGDTMTIARAQQGTSGQSFAVGSRVEQRVTAGSFEVISGGTYS